MDGELLDFSAGAHVPAPRARAPPARRAPPERRRARLRRAARAVETIVAEGTGSVRQARDRRRQRRRPAGGRPRGGRDRPEPGAPPGSPGWELRVRGYPRCLVSAPELSVVCKNCGSEVSPYVTECPYCGQRLRKRAPELEREGDEIKVRESRRDKRRRAKQLKRDERRAAATEQGGGPRIAALSRHDRRAPGGDGLGAADLARCC